MYNFGEHFDTSSIHVLTKMIGNQNWRSKVQLTKVLTMPILNAP
jgi:hypothetical protein